MTASAVTVDTSVTGKRHYTTAGGIRIASVTTILKMVGQDPFADDGLAALRGSVGNEKFKAIMQTAADLGTAVHEGINEALDPEAIPYPSDDPRTAKMVAGALTWVAKYVKTVHAVEAPFVSEAYGFAGTIDLIATLKGDEQPAVIDWKTSAQVLPTYRLQLAAYREGARQSLGYPVDRRLVIKVSKDRSSPGKVTAHEFSAHTADWAAFQNALSLFRWTKEYA
jgi:hypothetical protein